MVEESRTRTLVIGDVRANDRFLRVTWHPDTGTMVFSHWDGAVCRASTPVHLADASRVNELVIRALRDTVERPPSGVVAQPPGAGWLEKLRRAAKPSMARVFALRHSPASSAAEPGEGPGR